MKTVMIRSSKEFWRRYRANRAAVLGLVIFLAVIAMAIGAPYLTEFNPTIDLSESFLPPNLQHLAGTDDIGRDVMSNLLYGARISLLIGLTSAILSVAIGVLIGSIAGYFGARVDDILMRFTEVFQIVPGFFLALVIVALLGPSTMNIITVIGITTWPSTARLARAEFLSIREREFVEAAKGLGMSNRQIMLGEILPNASPPLIVNASLEVAVAILLESSLSFLGLGDPARASWGQMLNRAQNYLEQAWWMALFPGIALFLTIMALNLIGDGLNDALNPQLGERG